MKRIGFFSGALLSLCAAIASAQTAELAEISCENDAVCRIVDTRLPLRVLARPFAVLYKEKSEDQILNDNLRAFYPLYAFSREEVDYSDPANPTGWYKVGPTDQRAIGYMKAGDVVEWTQALIVSYAHPGPDDDRRHGVVGFSRPDTIDAIFEAQDRTDEALAIYDAIDDGQKPEGYVIREPGPGWYDIEEDFYLMPILAFRENDFAERDLPERLLRLITEIPGKRATQDEIAAGPGTGNESGPSPELEARLENLGVDIVFVMDMTGSMAPFIDRTKSSLNLLLTQFQQENLIERLNFGLIGYRDNHEMIPGLEFTARNFTPDLVSASDLEAIIASDVRAATTGSKDYSEEVYAGIELLKEIPWSDNSFRLVVLVGDASAHGAGHAQSTTQKEAEELRSELSAMDVTLFALHLRDQNPQYINELRADHAVAERQFSALARNEGLEGKQANYYPIPDANQDDYELAVKAIYEEVANLIDKASTGSLQTVQQSIGGQPGASATAGSQVAGDVAAGMQGAIKRFLVDYQGDDIEGKTDVVFWASDRDLADPTRPALEVRLLISRAELNDLTIALEAVYTALLEGQLTGEGFMKTLQSVVTAAVLPDAEVQDAARLAETSLLPKWLDALPYRSDVQSLNDALIQGMTDEERFQLEERLKSKIAYYKSTFADTDSWVVLTDEDKNVTERHVYPIPLENLP